MVDKFGQYCIIYITINEEQRNCFLCRDFPANLQHLKQCMWEKISKLRWSAISFKIGAKYILHLQILG